MQVLVVLDVQNEFSADGQRPVPNHTEALAASHRRIEEARREGRRIAFVRHHNKPHESPAFVPGTWGAEYSPGIGPEPGRPNEVEFQKDVFGAFTGTELGAWLDPIGGDVVLLVGFYAHMCVSTTVREGLMRGLRVLVDPDATGGAPLQHDLLGEQSAEEVAADGAAPAHKPGRGDQPTRPMSQLAPHEPTTPLDTLVAEIRALLGDDLIGLYLYGSLVSGGFDPEASDLDLVAVTSSEVGELDFARLERMHHDFVHRHPDWQNRLDIVYIGRATLSAFRRGDGSFAVISPGEPFHVRTDVADWLQTWYLLRETSVTLLGDDAAELVPPIARSEFVAALVRYADLMRTRSQEDSGPGALAYGVLTICRALQTVRTNTEPSKQEGAAWTRERMPEWAWLIDAALECRRSRGTIGFDDEPTRAAAQRFIGLLSDEIAGS